MTAGAPGQLLPPGSLPCPQTWPSAAQYSTIRDSFPGLLALCSVMSAAKLRAGDLFESFQGRGSRQKSGKVVLSQPQSLQSRAQLGA